ncbi:hypothetical protein [Geomonas limicola]|nr:hypothetical protein [Geomonas limicola]
MDVPEEIPEAGTVAPCPACNVKLNIYRESFGSRALHRTGNVSCAVCGAELGPHLHCQTCGACFPDFLVAQVGKRKARRQSKKLSLSFSPLPARQKRAVQLPSLDAALHPEAVKGPARKGAGMPKTLQLAIALAVIIALGVGGTFYYFKMEAEKKYAKNYALAAFCLQAGIERAQKTGVRMATEWKQRQDAGQSYTPRLSIDDERGFGLVESKLDQAMGKLGKAPESFGDCTPALGKLRTVYDKWHGQVQTPGNSLQAFNDNSAKIEQEYNKAIRDFKTSLPGKMREELTSASVKLKLLRPLVM